MAVNLETWALGDSETEKRLECLIVELFEERKGQWLVQIIGSQTNTVWELKVKGPQDFEWKRDLIGEDGEHTPDFVFQVLAEMLAENP